MDLKADIYPLIFEKADVAFPELQLVRVGDGWQSPLKLDGSQPKQRRKDKTVMTAQYPGNLLEQGGERLSLFDYIQRRDGLDNKATIEALKALAGIDGTYTPPPRKQKPTPKRETTAEAMAEVRDFTSTYLQWVRLAIPVDESPACEWLKARGIDPEFASFEGVSYFDSYKIGDISTETAIKSGIARTKSFNKPFIIIPYVWKTKVWGLQCRQIDPKGFRNTWTKSLFPYGLEACRNKSEVWIVEGELDALRLNYEAQKNHLDIGAIGIPGSAPPRMDIAKYLRDKKIYIAMDADDAGRKNANGTITALEGLGLDLNIINLPDGQDITDYLGA